MNKLDPMAGWYSAQELAGLPGMPKSDSAVMRSAKKNFWEARRKLRGKGDEYALRSLPDATRAHILGLAVNRDPTALPTVSAPAPMTAPAAKPSRDLPPGALYGRGMVRRPQPEEKLDDQERQARDAALILCRAVEAAQAELAARLLSGDARPELLAAAQATYLKPRQANGPLGGHRAQASRLEKMMKFYEAGRKTGDVAAFLVPGKRHKEGHDPAHVAAFLRFYCLPSRPPVSEAHRAMVPFLQERGLSAPSYSVAARIERALPVTVKYRGRVTGSEWRSLRPYVERDVSMFHSNDIWVGDGHSFKAKVAHPIHGQPFTPEITFILDWVSRKIVGWSIALSESTVAVSDAFRHAQLQTRARPLVYYSDNGSGQTGKMIDHPIAGTLARQGIGHETGLPGNPQARGIIERLWQVTLIRLACTYPTCTWKKADEHTVNKMLKVLNKKDGGGVKNPAFLTLTADVDTCVNDYNTHHAHRELDGAVPEQTY
jgi:putative transposase